MEFALRGQGSSGHEGLDIRQQIVAGFRVDLHGDGLGQIQAEDTQDRFCIYHMAACAKVHIVRITVDDVPLKNPETLFV